MNLHQTTKSKTTKQPGSFLSGWLVTNAFMRTKKFTELQEMFEAAAKKAGIRLKSFSNAELLAGMKLRRKPDFVLFWDKDVLLASYLESLGIPVFNSAKSIALCDDKGKTFLALKDSGLPLPKTVLAPFTFDTVGYTDLSFVDRVTARLGLPLVIKENYGSFGMQVYLANTREEIVERLKEISPKPCLFQEFLSERAGNDIRVQVVGNKVVCSMARHSDTDFRANVTIGGKMKAYEPTAEEKRMALKACKALGLSFGGVDIIYGKEGPVICEVNSNAHFKNILECTGVNVAEAIMEHIGKSVRKRKK
jgi:RimK family alpha-L-glutamate ligase